MQVDESVPKIREIAFFVKPNVRKMFVPDIGYTLFDCDLKQADAQVVAWEAGDEPLKEIFRSGEDLHDTNAKDIYSLRTAPTHHQRQMAKHGVHGTNFGAHPRTLAKKLDMTVQQASAFQARWFKLHPAIKAWHKRVEQQLMQTRTVRNAFGYRRIFFDRIDNILPEALAWVPQSTTVNVIDKGLLRVARELRAGLWGDGSDVQLLLQVHDSGVGQFKNHLYRTIRKQIEQCMLIPVPYDDPLTIPVEISCSRVSWGDCHKVPFEDDVELCPY